MRAPYPFKNDCSVKCFLNCLMKVIVQWNVHYLLNCTDLSAYWLLLAWKPHGRKLTLLALFSLQELEIEEWLDWTRKLFWEDPLFCVYSVVMVSFEFWDGWIFCLSWCDIKNGYLEQVFCFFYWTNLCFKLIGDVLKSECSVVQW